MYSFTGRVFPPMRRPLHLILHHLAVHLNVSTGGNLPPQLSDAGCERLYLLRIIGRGSFTLPAIERPALRRKSAMEHIFVLYQIQDTDTLHRKKPCLPLHIKTPICLSLMAKTWVHIVFAMKMYALRFSIKTSFTMLNLLSIFLASALDRKIRLQNRCLIVSEI